MRVAPAMVVLVLSGCSDSSGRDRALPGPCSAVVDGQPDIFATYAYDADDRLVAFDFDANEGVETATVRWTWSGDATPAEVTSRRSCDLCVTLDSTWTFEAAAVTRVDTGDEPFVDVHEPELRFQGDPFDMADLAGLSAPDSLLSHDPADGATVTYTYSGPPRQGTRTRTGSDGTVVELTYTDGLLVRWDEDGGPVLTWWYDDDGRLIRVDVDGRTREYERDGFGNLLRTRNADGLTTTYDYGCW